MSQILNSLDTRDLAMTMWLMVLVFWCFSKKEIRESFSALMSAFTQKTILIIFFIAIFYLLCITTVLQKISLWSLSQLKITIIWFFIAGISGLMDATKIGNDTSYIKEVFLKNFELSLLIDFYANLYKLPLVAEIIFVPITAILGAMLAISETDEKYAVAKNFLVNIFVVIGVFIIFYEAYKLLTNFNVVANINTFRDFILPITYNITYLPLVLVVSLYCSYESTFCRLQFLVKNKDLHSYTKWQLFINFGTNIRRINSWSKLAWQLELSDRKTIRDSMQREFQESAAQQVAKNAFE